MAQRESASFTPKRSLVRSQYRPRVGPPWSAIAKSSSRWPAVFTRGAPPGPPRMGLRSRGRGLNKLASDGRKERVTCNAVDLRAGVAYGRGVQAGVRRVNAGCVMITKAFLSCRFFGAGTKKLSVLAPKKTSVLAPRKLIVHDLHRYVGGTFLAGRARPEPTPHQAPAKREPLTSGP